MDPLPDITEPGTRVAKPNSRLQPLPARADQCFFSPDQLSDDFPEYLFPELWMDLEPTADPTSTANYETILPGISSGFTAPTLALDKNNVDEFEELIERKYSIWDPDYEAQSSTPKPGSDQNIGSKSNKQRSEENFSLPYQKTQHGMKSVARSSGVSSSVGNNSGNEFDSPDGLGVFACEPNSNDRRVKRYTEPEVATKRGPPSTSKCERPPGKRRKVMSEFERSLRVAEKSLSRDLNLIGTKMTSTKKETSRNITCSFCEHISAHNLADMCHKANVHFASSLSKKYSIDPEDQNCPLCKKKFGDQRNLFGHMAMDHGALDECGLQIQNNTKFDNAYDYEPTKGQFTCQLCTKQYISRVSY
jgi:hypothetical protein